MMDRQVIELEKIFENANKSFLRKNTMLFETRVSERTLCGALMIELHEALKKTKFSVQLLYRQKKTQQEMADITGVRASNIARFERASCMPTLIMLEKYANALGKHIEIRICEDEE